MTGQSVLCCTPSSRICPGSSDTFLSVQKLFDCTTYNGGKKLGRNVKPYVPLHLVHKKHAHTTVGFGNQLQAATDYYACHILDSRMNTYLCPLEALKKPSNYT